MQVEELTDEFDARRSTGYLCAATAGNFEQVILSAKCSHFIICFEHIGLIFILILLLCRIVSLIDFYMISNSISTELAVLPDT
jgi:hypothetical protein